MRVSERTMDLIMALAEGRRLEYTVQGERFDLFDLPRESVLRQLIEHPFFYEVVNEFEPDEMTYNREPELNPDR